MSRQRAQDCYRRHPDLCRRRMLCVFTEAKLRRLLARMLDEEEVQSPYGIRSPSCFHLDDLFHFTCNGQELHVDDQPRDSTSAMFGGNSNWRGPIWMPVNCILIRALYTLYAYYGDAFPIECPTGCGQRMSLFEVAQDLSDRLVRLCLPEPNGRRPLHGACDRFLNDPYWREYVLIYEYFHGDTGAGLSARIRRVG